MKYIFTPRMNLFDMVAMGMLLGLMQFSFWFLLLSFPIGMFSLAMERRYAAK